MNHFEFRGGVLHAEDVPVPDIARSVGTPFYCYSTATLERHFNVFRNSFAGLDAACCREDRQHAGQPVELNRRPVPDPT